MAISIKGNYRVIDIYPGKKDAYLTLLDKSEGGQVKIAVSLPLPPVVKPDALLDMSGVLAPRLFNGSLSLTFQGDIKTATEK